jgi:peroxiredoxin
MGPAYWNNREVTFPVALAKAGEKGANPFGRLADSYKIEDLPATYVIDREGRILTIFKYEPIQPSHVEHWLKK